MGSTTLTTSADCGAKAPLCIEQPVCESWSLAQPELRLSVLLRGWGMGERHRPIKPSTPTWRSSGLHNAEEAVVGDSRDRGPSSCRSARSEVVVLWKTKTTGKQLSMAAARRMLAMSCRAAVVLGLHHVDHGFRSPPDRRKLWSTSKEKTMATEKKRRRCHRRRCRRRCRRPSRTAQEAVLQLLGNHGPTRTVGPLHIHQSWDAPSKLWRDIGL